MDAETKTELEAAVFRRLVEHFQKRTDVQNIDLMILAGSAATAWATGTGKRRRKKASRWKRTKRARSSMACRLTNGRRRHQKEATPEQQAAFDAIPDNSQLGHCGRVACTARHG